MTRTLIVDDNVFISKMIQQQLYELGLKEVHLKHNADDALEFISSKDDVIDLILCDLQMPDKDGIEFLKELHKINKTVSVAILSGEDQSILISAEAVATQFGLNMIGKIQKPATPESLKNILGKIQTKKKSNRTFKDIDITVEDIREGMENNEIICHYQPLVDVATERPIGMESLARWIKKDGSMIPPGLFIPVAESSDIISPLTNQLFTHALDDSVRFKKEGIDHYLAFNVSNRLLTNEKLPTELLTLTQQSGFDAKNVILEITETWLEDDVTTMLEVTTRFRLKQFRLAIDDYGTGFSNLDRLSKLPFSELKIDCSFIWNARTNKKSAEILASTCQMARALGLKTVAEGVEYPEDLELIRRIGVDVAQGYHYSKPIPADELIEWWKKQSKN